MRAKLQAALRRLLAERERRHFTRVVIETHEDPRRSCAPSRPTRALGADFYVENTALRADGARTFTLTEDAPLSWDAFSRFITTLLALRGADLLLRGRAC